MDSVFVFALWILRVLFKADYLLEMLEFFSHNISLLKLFFWKINAASCFKDQRRPSNGFASVLFRETPSSFWGISWSCFLYSPLWRLYFLIKNSEVNCLAERVLFKTLECFPSALFPKIWNSIELELKETKSAKSFKRKVANIYIDSYAIYICKENCVSCG